MLTYDLPGHGYSSYYYHGYSPWEIVRDIYLLQLSLGWPYCGIIAHSLGSVLHHIYTVLFSEKVLFFVSLDSSLPFFYLRNHETEYRKSKMSILMQIHTMLGNRATNTRGYLDLCLANLRHSMTSHSNQNHRTQRNHSNTLCFPPVDADSDTYHNSDTFSLEKLSLISNYEDALRRRMKSIKLTKEPTQKLLERDLYYVDLSQISRNHQFNDQNKSKRNPNSNMSQKQHTSGYLWNVDSFQFAPSLHSFSHEYVMNFLNQFYCGYRLNEQMTPNDDGFLQESKLKSTFYQENIISDSPASHQFPIPLCCLIYPISSQYRNQNQNLQKQELLTHRIQSNSERTIITIPYTYIHHHHFHLQYPKETSDTILSYLIPNFFNNVNFIEEKIQLAFNLIDPAQQRHTTQEYAKYTNQNRFLSKL
jgi:hypothetical protein